MQVDLRLGLPLGIGPHRVEVDVPDLGVREVVTTPTSSVGDGGDSSVWVGADLDRSPVSLRVRVDDGDGHTVFDGTTTVTPELVQPSGPGCSSAFVVRLRATSAGQLAPAPELDGGERPTPSVTPGARATSRRRAAPAPGARRPAGAVRPGRR